MWFALQVGFHASVTWVDGIAAVAELSKDGSRAQVPAFPGEWRVSASVLDVEGGSHVQKKLDGLFIAESGRAVERSLGFGSAVAHESARFHIRFEDVFGVLVYINVPAWSSGAGSKGGKLNLDFNYLISADPE